MKEFTGEHSINAEWLSRQFERAATFRARRVINAHDPDLRITVFYFDCMVNGDRLNRDVIASLRRERVPAGEESLSRRVAGMLYAGTQEMSRETEKAAVQIASGDCVILVGDCPEAVILDIKGMAMRGIEQPDGEVSVAGPHEGFNENIISCLALIKKRLSSPKLRAELIKLGRRSNTAVCVLYMEGIARREIVKRILDKVKSITIDGVWDSNYVTEMILGRQSLLFPTVGRTQRPDVAADKLCEGRVVVLVNGSPVALCLPFLFTENFQTADDYYLSRPYGNVGRALRLIGFFLSILVPGAFIAMLLHHPAMLPNDLFYSIAAAGRGVPVGDLLEMILLFLVFETLRETGSRMPEAVGLALNIVGAIVLGQSAVEAGFVSAPMVIVVAFSGTVGLMVRELRGTVFFLRLGFIAAGAWLGWFGIGTMLLVLWSYLHSLQSAGLPYLYTFSPLYTLAGQDTFLRSKLSKMNFRQRLLSANRRRQK